MTHQEVEPEEPQPDEPHTSGEVVSLFDDAVVPVSDETSDGVVRRCWDSYLDACSEVQGRRSTKALDKKRRGLIERALRTHGEVITARALTGWALSPFHRGDNDRSQVYNDVALLLRDADHIERFASYHDEPPTKGGRNSLDDDYLQIQRVVLGNAGGVM